MIGAIKVSWNSHKVATAINLSIVLCFCQVCHWREIFMTKVGEPDCYVICRLPPYFLKPLTSSNSWSTSFTPLQQELGCIFFFHHLIYCIKQCSRNTVIQFVIYFLSSSQETEREICKIRMWPPCNSNTYNKKHEHFFYFHEFQFFAFGFPWHAKVFLSDFSKYLS